MNVLEKILEEIQGKMILVATSKEHYNQPQNGKYVEEVITIKDAENIIRSHMDEVPNCEGCSRRKWYQKGFEDGKKDGDWIPYTSQNIPRKKGLYLVTCDDEEYPVKRMRFKKEDEYGLWYDDYGIYDDVILAWQPLPEPYIKNPK